MRTDAQTVPTSIHGDSDDGVDVPGKHLLDMQQLPFKQGREGAFDLGYI
jgi:hypothetical protein